MSLGLINSIIVKKRTSDYVYAKTKNIRNKKPIFLRLQLTPRRADPKLLQQQIDSRRQEAPQDRRITG